MNLIAATPLLRMSADLESIEELCGRHDRGEVDGGRFVAELPAFIARAIGCSRAGVRVLIETSAGSVLRTVAMYEQSSARLVEVPDLAGDAVQPYLASLGRQGGIIAPDVAKHPGVSQLLHRYGAHQQLRSLMDVGISLDGVVCGTLSCEQLLSPQQWSPRQLLLLRHIAVRTRPALAHVVAEHAAARRRPRELDDA